MTTIYFKHDYTKLDREVFLSIRSVNYMKDYNIKQGPYHQTESPSKRFIVKIITYEDIVIQDIPLILLQYDAHPKVIKSHQDYVDLLNSFVKKYNPNVITTKKRIIWLKKKQTTSKTTQRKLM